MVRCILHNWYLNFWSFGIIYDRYGRGQHRTGAALFYVGGYRGEKQAVIPRVAVAGGYGGEKQTVIPGVAVAGGYRGEKQAVIPRVAVVGGYRGEKQTVIPRVAVGMHRSRTMRGKRELGI